jgi:peptidoglycan/xylan/chitin deacetylase (PgdA/CDA1 family)
MRRRMGVFVAALFYYSGLVWLARWWMRRSPQQLIILNYHRASGGDLLRHLLYLRKHYRMLHLEEALHELYMPQEKKKQSEDKRTSLVLTFDDGYRDNYTHAYALAHKLRVPITIFLVPGYMESGDYFWWGEGRRLVQRARVREVTIDGICYRLSDEDERAALIQSIDRRLRRSRAVAEREDMLVELRQLLAVSETILPEEEGERPLTWAQVREMQVSGYVSFGAHTLHHPVLAYLSDPDEVRREVKECQSLLEKRLGQPIRTFAYPIGRSEHTGEVAVQAVKEAGYMGAVTTEHGINTPATNPYLLHRVLGDVSRHWLVMAAETSGIWHLFAPVWKAIIGRGESA